MSQAQANTWVHWLTGLLNETLGKEQQFLEQRSANLETILSNCPSLELVIDWTYCLINCSKNKDKQKVYYSGKQKAHSLEDR